MSFFSNPSLNKVIPVGEFESGMNFLYNFNNNNSTAPREGNISASLISATNYNLKIHSKDLHLKDNASFLNEFTDNIEYIYISSNNTNGLLFNASHTGTTSSVYTFYSSLVSGNRSDVSGESIVEYTLTRGSGGGSGGIEGVTAGTGLTGGGITGDVTLGIDSTVTTLTGSQTLTNKTLTSAVLTSAVLNAGVSGTAILDEDDMASDSATHLATQQSIKAYVDSVTQGLNIKESCRVATTSSGTLTSSFENGDTIDDITLDTNDRILIKDQSTSSENGIYVVKASGAPDRSADMSIGDTAGGDFTFVTEGIINGDNGFVCTSNGGSDIVGTHSLTFTQFSGAGQITAGTGLDKSGNTLSIEATVATLTGSQILTNKTLETPALGTPASGVLTNCTGTASNLTAGTATALQTSRNIGGVSFDGTADINLQGVNTSGNQDTTGNAATATILSTARTIGGVAFDGSENIDLPGVNASGNQSTTGNAATATNVAYTGLTGSVPTWNQSTTGNAATATILSTARTIGGVAFDGSENIDLPGVNASGNQNTSGLAATATALATARTIGGVSFDGSANIDLPGVNVTGNQNTSGLAATATALATARTIGGVSFDGSANIDLPGVNSAGNQATSGLAATATILATARTIGGVSFNGSANIDLPGVNASGNQNTSGSSGSCTGNAATATKIAGITNSNIVQLEGVQHITGAKTFSNSTTFSDTTASSSTTTGAVIVYGGVGIGGKMNVGGDITAFATSDKRLKNNLEKINDPLDKLNKINGYTFDWIEKEGIHSNKGHDIGVIAQEIEEVLPEVVVTRENGYKAVRYEKIVPLLIETIKEQQKQINKLNDRLEKLENMFN